MSPEQIHRDPDISSQTDIYSLGAVLYEVLSGQTPFTGDKVQEVISRVLEDTPAKPSEIARMRVPALLDDLAMKCLAKRPDRRIGSVGEMLRLLQEDWRSGLLV